MTINLHKGFSAFSRRSILAELRHAIRAVGSELVFLQEVLGAHKRPLRQAITAPQYEFLADSIWPHHSYGRNSLYTEGHHGNALLSKFPILRHENVDASIPGAEGRGMLRAELDMGEGVTLHAICVHFGLRERHRHQQLRMLCDAIDRIPANQPLIVAGDFNDWRGRAHRVLQECASLHEVFTSTTGLAARTFPAFLPLLRLDRIYVRNVRHQPLPLPIRPWAQLSDHAPLAAAIYL